jgi:hypothetical protein
MEGRFNRSVIERLPLSIRSMNSGCREIYIYLRLRKPEREIARLLNLSQDETREKIGTVRSALIGAGQLDLIEDPEIISIHAETDDEEDLPLRSSELDPEKKLLIAEFISGLKEIVTRLPEHQSRILMLRYKYHLPAKDILDFCRKLDLSLVPDKDAKELNEQDIFYALNTALKEVLKRLKMKYKEEKLLGMENLKYVFEEIGV